MRVGRKRGGDQLERVGIPALLISQNPKQVPGIEMPRVELERLQIQRFSVRQPACLVVLQREGQELRDCRARTRALGRGRGLALALFPRAASCFSVHYLALAPPCDRRAGCSTWAEDHTKKNGGDRNPRLSSYLSSGVRRARLTEAALPAPPYATICT